MDRTELKNVIEAVLDQLFDDEDKVDVKEMDRICEQNMPETLELLKQYFLYQKQSITWLNEYCTVAAQKVYVVTWAIEVLTIMLSNLSSDVRSATNEISALRMLREVADLQEMPNHLYVLLTSTLVRNEIRPQTRTNLKPVGGWRYNKNRK